MAIDLDNPFIDRLCRKVYDCPAVSISLLRREYVNELGYLTYISSQISDNSTKDVMTRLGAIHWLTCYVATTRYKPRLRIVFEDYLLADKMREDVTREFTNVVYRTLEHNL